jgi:hypothetical protein
VLINGEPLPGYLLDVLRVPPCVRNSRGSVLTVVGARDPSGGNHNWRRDLMDWDVRDAARETRAEDRCRTSFGGVGGGGQALSGTLTQRIS